MAIIRRKVVQIGEKGSFVISLPKKWCHNNEIVRGSEVELTIDELGPSTILLNTVKLNSNSEKKKDITIQYDKNQRSNSRTPRAILGAYLEGFENITIKGIPQKSKEKLQLRKTIRRLLKKLYGSRIVELPDLIRIEISPEITPPNLLLNSEIQEPQRDNLEDKHLPWHHLLRL